jgi:hypothetical protein
MGDDETNRAIRAKSIHGKQEQTETSRLQPEAAAAVERPWMD